MSDRRPHRLCYVSDAIRPMAKSELIGLLARARRNNASDSITGLLLYSEGHFMQLLEGPVDRLWRRFDRIRVDGRHRDLRMILDEPALDGRLFAGWQMGWLDVGRAAPLDRDRLQRMVDAPRDGSDTIGRAEVIALLRDFRNQLPKRHDNAPSPAAA